jgi:TM2 domain-containing membrane protein YozV
MEQISEKNFMVTLYTCALLGIFGGHRFYVGKIGTGFLMLITLGCFGMWVAFDAIQIQRGKFTDKEGKFIKNPYKRA